MLERDVTSINPGYDLSIESGPHPTDGRTLVIETNPLINNKNTFTIPTNTHVRIIPGVMSGFQHMTNEQLFVSQNDGHLLFGDPDKPITVDCITPREQHLFDLEGAGSLVLRNVTVKNAVTNISGTPTNNALVASASARLRGA